MFAEFPFNDHAFLVNLDMVEYVAPHHALPNELTKIGTTGGSYLVSEPYEEVKKIITETKNEELKQ